MGRPEQKQTDDAGNEGQQGRQLVVSPFHLLDEDDDKQGSQRKVDAGGIEGNERADEGTKDTQYYPVEDGHDCSQHISPFFVDIIGKIMGAMEGIILICQRIDEKIFPEAEGTEFLDEGQAVEDMAAVQQQ